MMLWNWRFLKTVKIPTLFCQVVKPCSLSGGYQHFERIYLHWRCIQYLALTCWYGEYQTAWCHMPEHCNMIWSKWSKSKEKGCCSFMRKYCPILTFILSAWGESTNIDHDSQKEQCIKSGTSETQITIIQLS